jgi:hypothetical protein
MSNQNHSYQPEAHTSHHRKALDSTRRSGRGRSTRRLFGEAADRRRWALYLTMVVDVDVEPGKYVPSAVNGRPATTGWARF